MPSKEYTALKRNIASLRQQFLNFDKRLNGAYSQYELTQCRAYITFCHAEFEIYLESTALRVVERAERHWQQHMRVTNAIASMLVYRTHIGLDQTSIALPDNPKQQKQQSKFETLIGKAISAQKSVINRNHGIKPSNLAALFLPIGMKPADFDEPLLIQLKNLGERRGDHVHQNSQVSLPKIRDPFDDELNDIEFLSAEIEPFDRLAKRLK